VPLHGDTLTKALERRYGASDALADHFAQASVGGPAGKIRLAYKSGLITKQMRNFLDLFAELRNELVHSVEQVRFDLKAYVNSLERQDRTRLVRAMKDHLPLERVEEHLLRDPQARFIITVTPILTHLFDAAPACPWEDPPHYTLNAVELKHQGATYWRWQLAEG